jgi:hypothetical protein
VSTYPWEFECSVEANASAEFAWRFWTNFANWNELEPGVEFTLDGPFAPGTTGCTKMPGQEPRAWLICEVEPNRFYSQNIPLDNASLMVSMRFEELPEGRTRITQGLWLEGDGAQELIGSVRAFEATTADGLKRIAEIIERSQTR